MIGDGAEWMLIRDGQCTASQSFLGASAQHCSTHDDTVCTHSQSSSISMNACSNVSHDDTFGAQQLPNLAVRNSAREFVLYQEESKVFSAQVRSMC